MKPNTERSKRTITFLWIFTIVTLVSIVAHVRQYQFLEGIESGTITMLEYNSNLLIQSISALAQLVVYLLTGIFFIQWFRRAYYNLHQIDTNLSYGEGWAAGAWFVPFMNWARPYKIMKEMMVKSEDILEVNNLLPSHKNRTSVVNTWWTLWIILSIVSSISDRIQVKIDDLEVLFFCTGLDILIALAYVPLTIVTVRMIKTYNELEEFLPQIESAHRRPLVKNDDLLDSI